MTAHASDSALERWLAPESAFRLLLALASAQYLAYAVMLAGGHAGAAPGGDFSVFWSAGREILAGRLSDIYSPEALGDALDRHRPEASGLGLFWRYPPHASLAYSLIGAPPFYVAYAIWTAAGAACLLAALRLSGLSGRLLGGLMLSPLVYGVVATGQVSLFMAGFLLVAAGQASTRPILAGVCAGLLTFKPQLGLLLPVAYLAGGCWRALASAAASTLGLVLASVLIAGPAPWRAFAGALGGVGDAVAGGVMPFYKMTGLSSAASLAGAPDEVAATIGLAGAAALAIFVGWVWRRTARADLRVMALCAATPLASPYAFYYDLALLVPAAAMVITAAGAHRGAWADWLPGERLILAGLTLAAFALPGPATRWGVGLAFALALAAFACVLRRIVTDLRAEPTGKSAAQPLSGGISRGSA